jgi:hypothetical protein
VNSLTDKGLLGGYKGKKVVWNHATSIENALFILKAGEINHSRPVRWDVAKGRWVEHRCAEVGGAKSRKMLSVNALWDDEGMRLARIHMQ